MMNSPAQIYFRPLRADLDSGGWLCAMFLPSPRGSKVTVLENIRKGGTRLISHDLRDADAVVSLACRLGEKHPEVPLDQLHAIVERSRTLFSGSGALSFRSNSTKPAYCKVCGVPETDEANFEYFPPVPGTPLDQGSLGVQWSKCCSQGRREGVEVFGTIAETAEASREILTAMMDTATAETRPQLQAALELICEEARIN